MSEQVSKIRVLSDVVINQIAAGEVVERPASVLKELVENSLDAGAAFIEVEIVDGGRRLLRVSDDGCGMDRDSALLSVERHATSKLTELKDLDRIATMGFRGEALAAISAVSQFTLISRPADSEVGTEVLIFGGKIQDVRDVGAPVGTSIVVRNLFFNVPARRKFLRMAQTEFTHIRQTFLLEAVANIGVGFSLIADDRDVYQLPAAPDLLTRIRDLYGEELAGHLVPLQYGNGVVEISGYAGMPPYSRTDREYQLIFINGRPSGSPVLNFAIQNAYKESLQGGRYAPLFLNISIPPELVDVNVHPAKKEVRFHRPTEVRDVVIEAIRLAISGRRREENRFPPKLQNQHIPSNKVVVSPPDTASSVVPTRPVTHVQQHIGLPAPEPTKKPAPSASAEALHTSPGRPPETPGVKSESAPWSSYRLVGRLQTGYVILEIPDGMVLLDPPAAHLRVLYERFQREVQTGNIPSQGLLPPVVVECSHSQAQILKKHMSELRSFGFGITEFGENTILLDSMPVLFSGVNPKLFVSDMADGLIQAGKMAANDWIRPYLVALAARHTVRLRQNMSEEELCALIDELAATEMPYTTPQGKPTMIFMSARELNRKFGRD